MSFSIGFIFFIPTSGWGWLLLAVIVFIFYRRLTVHNIGRTVGNFRAAAKPEEAARRSLARREDALEGSFGKLDLKPGASYDQVKSSYRELVKVWHPDRFGHDAKLKERANIKLMEINQAYELLKAHFEK